MELLEKLLDKKAGEDNTICLNAYAQGIIDSKAPEMIEMLNRISGEMLRSDFVLDEKWYDQIQKLINEATNV